MAAIIQLTSQLVAMTRKIWNDMGHAWAYELPGVDETVRSTTCARNHFDNDDWVKDRLAVVRHGKVDYTTFLANIDDVWVLVRYEPIRADLAEVAVYALNHAVGSAPTIEEVDDPNIVRIIALYDTHDGARQRDMLDNEVWGRAAAIRRARKRQQKVWP
jgi:hypothetical protein